MTVATVRHPRRPDGTVILAIASSAYSMHHMREKIYPTNKRRVFPTVFFQRIHP